MLQLQRHLRTTNKIAKRTFHVTLRRSQSDYAQGSTRQAHKNQPEKPFESVIAWWPGVTGALATLAAIAFYGDKIEAKIESIETYLHFNDDYHHKNSLENMLEDGKK